jgi:hypothetical protein
MAETIDAIALAKRHDIDPKAFRAALRAAQLRWHIRGTRWVVTIGGPQHRAMMLVLTSLKGRRLV